MKLISWNVNGLRACITKGFYESFHALDGDIFAIQETKMQPDQAVVELPGYEQFWNSAEKKGYSGTAVFARNAPIAVTCGIGIEEHDKEGRVITAEYDSFFFVVVYTPNAQRGLTRLAYRIEWEKAFREYLCGLDAKKPVIVCGDMNVAHKEIDLKNPKSNVKNAGFTPEERQCMTELLDAGFTDSFRYLYPDRTDAYSWWSYMANARERNVGWRIDYFLVSDRIADKIKEATIHPDVYGSDHCPVGLEIDI